MTFIPSPQPGQTTSANSSPVVIASDQTPVEVAGKYNATSPTLSDGQKGEVQLDANGNAKVYLATRIDSVNDSITSFAYGNSYTNITTNTTTTIKSAPGVMRSLSINTRGASGNTITVYDGLTATGTKIATIDSTVSLGGFLADLGFITGLTIVTAGGTAPDITVVYR